MRRYVSCFTVLPYVYECGLYFSSYIATVFFWYNRFAETKRESKENDKSLHFTQKPHASADLDEGNNDQPLTQFSTAKDPVDGETDDIDDFHPLTQRPEKEEEVNESNVEKSCSSKEGRQS